MRRVNLIVGKNNVGKSTLLEAISVFLANGSEDHLRKLLANRGEDIVTSSDADAKTVKAHYLSLFNGRKEIYSKKDNTITIEDDKESIFILQVYIGETTEIDNNGKRLLAIKIMFEEDMPKDLSAFTRLSSGLFIQTIKSGILIMIMYRAKTRSCLIAIRKFLDEPSDKIERPNLAVRLGNIHLFFERSTCPSRQYPRYTPKRQTFR